MVESRVIDDPVYGPTEINESVLLDLVDSPTLQRLKGISQLGLPQEYHYLKTFSRFDHSVGTMILVRRIGGSVEEQIAALLHDSSHTAFSHMIDWMEGTQHEDSYQDNIHESFLNNSGVSAILSQHMFDIRRISDHRNFHILEQPIPRLCGDRADYALRQMKIGGIKGISTYVVPTCVDSLITHGGRIVFNNLEAASLFGRGFLSLYLGDWGSRESIGRFMIFANILQDARDHRIINTDDLFQDDAFVIKNCKLILIFFAG